MRIQNPTKRVTLVAAALMLLGGCQSPGRTARSEGATTPQEKARQEQLSNMSEQDAEEAGLPAKKRTVPRPAGPDRRTGQRVVDQPGVRH